MIRALDPTTDAAHVLDLYCRAADYVLLESGRVPSSDLVEEFFTDAPPGMTAASSVKLGQFDGERLVGLSDMAFGYPEPDDAYIGLLMLARDARGQGLGRTFLRYLEEVARRRGAARIFLAVLDSNPRARSFWEREGFAHPKVFPPVAIGDRTHVRIRLHKTL